MGLALAGERMNLQYDVLKGTPDNAMWLGNVRGLGRAIELMNRMAEIQPGDYFVRIASSNRVVASVRTEETAKRTTELSTAPAFEIFKGFYPDKEAIWVETVHGLGHARERMEQIAVNAPGPYFVYSTRDNLVMAISDTTGLLETRPQKAKTSGAA
jgi:hypothetical protein